MGSSSSGINTFVEKCKSITDGGGIFHLLNNAPANWQVSNCLHVAIAGGGRPIDVSIDQIGGTTGKIYNNTFDGKEIQILLRISKISEPDKLLS